MNRLWQIAYDCFAVPLIRATVRVLAPFRPKVSRGLEGRVCTFPEIENYLASLPGAKVIEGGIWFHGTSVGEFLQAVPLMKRLKMERPSRPIYFSFFSPSVEERARRFPHCDLPFYLPEDTRANIHRLFELLRPGLVIFSKFDIWRNMVVQAHERNVPTAVIAATLSPGSGRLNGFSGSFHRSFYPYLDLVCAISDEDSASFGRMGVPAGKRTVTGDTRFDQTFERAGGVREDDPLVRPFHGWTGKRVFALGSTWPEDEDHLLPAVQTLAAEFPDLRFILAPHENTAEHLEGIGTFLEKNGLEYSRYNSFGAESPAPGMVAPGARAVLIDRMGVLAAVYRAADVVYVGGGFGSGVHNVMEPACFGLPVIFGPKHLNSYEARLMRGSGGAFSVADSREAVAVVRRLLRTPGLCGSAGGAALSVVQENLGATDRTLRALAERFPAMAGQDWQ